MKPSPWKTAAYVYANGAVGSYLLYLALSDPRVENVPRFVCYLVIATLSSKLKVTLPGLPGTMSVNFLFILLAVLELSFFETVTLTVAAVTLQMLWRPKKRPTAQQMVFNLGSMVVAASSAYGAFHGLRAEQWVSSLPILLVLAASTYFLTNTLPVATVISLSEGRSVRKVWQECYFWFFPYYLVGAFIAGLFHISNRSVGWQLTPLVLPVMFWIYRSYRLYLERLQAEKNHAQEIAALQMRTIEALALAIDAKDHTTHDHLRRVQVYAIEIARELGLPEGEIEALRAAAVLHDIGKLGVPEHIISKPGRLTPEEFEKMKIHPVVGAEILERVQFPYPVVPIVRSHHEKWDGTGYPDGLKREEIPIGARILAAVDCLDALASDRQYRRALPLDEAMQQVAREAGTSFDPKIVAVLQSRYRLLEAMAEHYPVERRGLSTSVRVSRGAAPAAGFEAGNGTAASGADGSVEFVSSIAAARQEVQALFELTSDLGNSLSVHETLSFLDVRLKRIIRYDSMAVYLKRDNLLIPEYVNGEDFRLFAALEIPLGEGLAGWVAENNRPIMNGNPAVEPGYQSTPANLTNLRSALAVPLQGINDVVIGALCLYHRDTDAFNRDHLRILQAINYKVAMAIENAVKYRQAERSATTDGLTGLPNARSLFLHLDAELSRSRREGIPLAVLVCDLDGFKQINDRFGHLEGNRVLQMVAQGLKDSCRAYDYVARMGGDEFVLVLPQHQPGSLQSKLSRLSAMVTDVGRRVCGEDVLALSVGEAFYPADGCDAEQLLAEADRKMYQMKQVHKAVPRTIAHLDAMARSMAIQ